MLDKAVRTFLEKSIGNEHTREAYNRAISYFQAWCSKQTLPLLQVRHRDMTQYVKELISHYSTASTRQHLAAIKSLYDWLMIRDILDANPVSAVIGCLVETLPTTEPILKPQEVTKLMASIDCRKIIGLRDRALLGLTLYNFVRTGEVIKMNVGDFVTEAGTYFFLPTTEGKRRKVSAHPQAATYCQEYLAAANLKSGPLFRAATRHRRLSPQPVSRTDVLKMVKRRCRRNGLAATVSYRTLRTTALVHFLAAGGSVQTAKLLAGHSQLQTTSRYFRQGQILPELDIQSFRYENLDTPNSLQSFIANSGIFRLDLDEEKD